jgi:antagonist of KipI
MSLRVIRPGFLSTLQDAGRRGYQSQGVPASGAMDRDAMVQANILVGNAENGVVIEMALHGAEFEAETDMLIALSGGGSAAYVDETKLAFDKPLGVRKGAIIRFLPASFGRFTYLAVAGGFEVPAVMNSRATYLPSCFGGLQGRAFQREDRIALRQPGNAASGKTWRLLQWNKRTVGEGYWGLSAYHKLYLPKVVRVLQGPEWAWFTEASRSQFFGTAFRPTADSNRMGYRLEGPLFERAQGGELISTAVGAGTIQCLPNGALVVLMADAQTTGGYPRIGQVAAVDIPLCAQTRTQEVLFFKPISWTEAEALLLKRERWFQNLKHALDSQIRGV